MKRAMPSLDGITWERLEREGAGDLSVRRARTSPGRRSCSRTAFPDRGRPRQAGPGRRPAAGRAARRRLPLVLTTGRTLEHWHTGAMTRRASNLDALEPEAIVVDELAATCAGSASARRPGPGRDPPRRDRADGPQDNRDVPARRGLHPVLLRRGRRQHPDQPALDPFGKIPEFKFCAARLEPLAVPAAAE